jgi:hypothetical protein
VNVYQIEFLYIPIKDGTLYGLPSVHKAYDNSEHEPDIIIMFYYH